MVIDYLNHLKEQYMEQRLSLDKEKNNLIIQLKENVEFVRMLEESDDPNYESFTPRNVFSKNKQKIDELLDKQKEIKSSIEETTNRQKELFDRIEELNSIINEEKNQIHHSAKQTSTLENLPLNDLKNIINKMELCIRLTDIDPVRCRMELSTILKKLNCVFDSMEDSE